MSPEIRWAAVGGTASALIIFAFIVVTGGVTGVEGLRILENVLPTIRFLASGAVAASATILALLLTLLGLSFDADHAFSAVYYRRIGRISFLSTSIMIVSVAILLVVTVPLNESEGLLPWIQVAYYTLAVGASLVGGLLIAVVLMLNTTIFDLISLGHPTAATRGMIASEDRPGGDAP